jgi:hypothetical protein
MDLIGRIIDALKTFYSPAFKVACFITSGILLFLNQYLSFLYLNQIISDYKPVIGIIFVFSCVSVIVDCGFHLFEKANKYIYSELWKKRRIKKYIVLLNNSEMAILREFFIQGKDDIKLPINNPDVAGLIDKGILKVTNLQFIDVLPIGIVRYVYISYEAKQLVSSKSIGWPEGPRTRQDLIDIKETRPQFIRVILNKKESAFESWINL